MNSSGLIFAALILIALIAVCWWAWLEEQRQRRIRERFQQDFPHLNNHRRP